MTWARGGTWIPASFSTAVQVGQVVHHTAEIVDAIGVRDVGVPGLTLAHLFRPPVMEPDVRHRVDDLFAVELQGDPQHAVRAGVLGADIEEHEIGVIALAAHAPVLRLETQRLLLGQFLLRRQVIRPHLGRARGVVLAQRVAHPASWASECARDADDRQR